MKVLSVVGNRPQFIKAAAVSGLVRREHDELLVHTGQHFDDELSAVFFRELGLPAPDRVALPGPQLPQQPGGGPEPPGRCLTLSGRITAE